jgi:hypothetical protein
VSAEEYDALAERLAEAEAARDQWHADYSRVVAASEERMRRLAEAERLLWGWSVYTVASRELMAETRTFLRPADSADVAP